MKPTRIGKTRSLRWLLFLCLGIAIAVALLLTAGSWASGFAKAQLIRVLRERYQSDVELRSLSISLFPYLRATGEDLILRHKGRTDVPPLMKLRRFTAQASLTGLFRSPKRLGRVQLEGL